MSSKTTSPPPSPEEGSGLTQGLAIQLVALGVMLGSKETRKLADAEDWQSDDLAAVVSEIQHAGGFDKGYTYLKRWLLDVCGVDWKLPVKPVEAILSKLKRDACKGRVVRELTRISEANGMTLDHHLDAFFRCVARAYWEAEPEIAEWYEKEYGPEKEGSDA